MTAAATRKLQKEIDNVLKKVDDGISEFSDYWEQAAVAGSNQQKEKLGEELKKSINKLQRFRVQIREWLAQSGVQNNSKDKLEDARKRVENDMQRFKDFERELKTKAFSTCALARGDELELEEAEKMKYQEWLTQTIQSLNDQLDQFEADLELLGNKRSLSSDDKARQAQLKTLQDRHRWHIKKLEQILRGVDNDAIDLGDLALVRESIDLYVENNQGADCYHDEGVYDCFDLAEFEDKAPMTPAGADVQKENPASSKCKEDPQKGKAKEKEKRRKDEKKDKKKDDRWKKTAGAPTNAAAEGPGARVEGKVAQPGDAREANGHGECREQAESDETKVQEDQLLSEAAEFICKICQIHVAGCGPKLTSCSHLFCGDCIAQWFNQHPDTQTWAQRARCAGPDRVVPCPVCKQPLNEKRDLYPVCGVTSRSENLLLWRMLSSLKIMCANHPKVRPDGNCEWVGEYGSYQKHAAQCQNQPPGSGGDISPTAAAQQAPPRPLPNDSESEVGGTANSSPAATPPSKPQPAPHTHVEGLPAGGVGTAADVPAVDTRPPAGKATAQHAAEPAPTSEAPAAATPAPAPAPVPAPAQAPAQAPAAPPTQAAALTAPVASRAPSAVPAASEAVTPAPAPATQALSPQAPKAATAAAPTQTAVATGSATAAPTPAPVAAPAVGASGTVVAGGTSTGVGATAASAQRHAAASETRARENDTSFTAHAVSSFEATGANMVPVRSGDLLQVFEQHATGWTYAKNLSISAAGTFGWIPSWIVPQQLVEEPKENAAPQQQHKVQAVATSQPTAASGAAVTSGTPVSEVRPVMRASSTFAGNSPSQLTLTPADLVEVVERHASGWTYGRKVCDSRGEGSVEGWFPDWVVAQK